MILEVDSRPSLEELEMALRQSWSRDTSSDPEGWSPRNPAWGQCAVTALVVHGYLGGELLRAVLHGKSHYWNRLPSGEIVDLTIEQFGRSLPLDSGEPRTQEYVMSFPATVRRYWLLLDSVQSRLLAVHVT
jgi:hypothetical protein